MSHPRCLRCDTPLADGGLAGQCPRCLASLAFGDGQAGAEAGADSSAGRGGMRETGGRGREGDFELVRELGRGGIGVVYEARQRSLNRRVAVKMLLGAWARPGMAPRFQAEAEAAARLRHPGIVAVHEMGELDGQPYLAMELVDGPSLADLVRTRPLGPGRAARYVRLVAEAIAHAHAHDVLHRDLKPSNVLVDGADHPRVTDFGLAKRLDAPGDHTRTGDLVGSPNYLPPEVVSGGRAGVAGDVYALGAILYQLLTARPPFVGETVAATLQQVVATEPVPPRQLNAVVPVDLETVCLKCLRKEPRERYASAAALAAELARFEAGLPVEARPLSPVARLGRWCRRNPVPAVLSGALAVTVLLGMASVLVQWRRAEGSRENLARNLYAADVAAAAAALKEGNLGRARSLLLRHGPDRGTSPGSLPARLPTVAGDAPEFAWRWLWARCQGDDAAILGAHPWIVTCVAVSPDGRWAATGSQEQPEDTTHCLALWSLGTGSSPDRAPVRWPASSNTIWSVAFTGDGRTLAAAGLNGVRFWDVETGEPKSGYPSIPGQELALAGNVLVASPGHPFFDAASPAPLLRMDLATREVRELPVRGRHPALSPDGRRLAVLDGDRNLVLHDAETGRELFRVATNHLVFRLRFSPSGAHLVASGRMTAAKVWDLASPGAPPRVFRTAHNVWDAVFTPDGGTLVVATSHQQLQVWDVASAEPRGVLAGHDNEVWAVAAIPDGLGLVSGSKDCTVRRWPLAPRPGPASVPLWRHAPPRFSPDGARLLTYAHAGTRAMSTVWELAPPSPGGSAPPRRVGSVPGFPRGFAPDGRSVLYLREGRPALDWRVVEDGRVVRSVELEGAATNLCVSELALAGDARSLTCPDPGGEFGRWSTEDGRRWQRWRDDGIAAGIRSAHALGGSPHRLFRGLAASHSGRWLAMAPLGVNAAVVADFETGRTLRLRGHRDDIAGLAFSRDERRLATGSVDGTIRLWDVGTGTELAELPGHLESVEAVAFSPDGATLASVNPGIEITFWHLPTRRELVRWPHGEAGYHLVFSPDGRRLALGVTEGNLGTETDRVELWDAPDATAVPDGGGGSGR